MGKEELLYNKLYEKTKDCGRTQFVRLLMDKERENKELKEQLQQKENIINKVREKLQRGITFCENDSQGIHNKCNIAINREKKVLEILDNKGE